MTTKESTKTPRIRIEPGQTRESLKIIELPLESIRRNPNQPRKQFDEAALAELAASIEKHGLLQPVTVSKDPRNKNGFLLVAGERRFRAFESLGRDVIPAIYTSGNVDEIALIENLQREDLNAFEEADALARLKKKYGYNNVELGQTIGKARSTVSEILRINDLPRKVKQDVLTSDVNKSVLIELAKVKDKKEQLKLWKDIKDRGVTVRQARATKKQVPMEEHELDTVSKRTLTSAKRMISELERIAKSNEGKALPGNSYDELLTVYDRFVLFMQEEAQRQQATD